MSRSIEPALYRQIMGHFPTGVVVVAAPGPAGTAIGSFTSLSLDPPLVQFSIAKTSSSWPTIREAGVFCVSVLAEDQEFIGRKFAQSGIDKFAGLDYDSAPTGSPKIDGCTAWVDCEITNVLDGGDHDIVVGGVREMRLGREVKPLLFFRGGYGL